MNMDYREHKDAGGKKFNDDEAFPGITKFIRYMIWIGDYDEDGQIIRRPRFSHSMWMHSGLDILGTVRTTCEIEAYHARLNAWFRKVRPIIWEVFNLFKKELGIVSSLKIAQLRRPNRRRRSANNETSLKEILVGEIRFFDPTRVYISLLNITRAVWAVHTQRKKGKRDRQAERVAGENRRVVVGENENEQDSNESDIEGKMSKIQLKKWISEFPEGVFTTDGRVVYCQPCSKEVSCSEVFQLKQHSATAKHPKSLESFMRSKNTQPFVSASLENVRDSFAMDLCNALIMANIPFYKLSSAPFRGFLEKYCNRLIPDESTLRKNHMKELYQIVRNRIKASIGTSYIWASVDATTDMMGRYVANLIVGKLDSQGASPPYLVSVKMLEQTNHSTISRFVNDGLKDLLADGEKENRLLLLVTDAASYMKKAADVLSALYPKMIHVFTKAPTRTALYKDVYGNLPLPPEPILTRWGTWIKAALFYSENFQQVKSVVERLNPRDAVAIQCSIKAFNRVDIAQKLAYIQSNFALIPDAITKLEKSGMPLIESLNILSQLKTALSTVPGEIGQQVRGKLKYVLDKNPGINRLSEITNVLEGRESCLNMNPNMIASMKFASIMSCDVERSFSVYKNLLAENRTNITPEHLEMYMICMCEMSDSHHHLMRSESEEPASSSTGRETVQGASSTAHCSGFSRVVGEVEHTSQLLDQFGRLLLSEDLLEVITFELCLSLACVNPRPQNDRGAWFGPQVRFYRFGGEVAEYLKSTLNSRNACIIYATAHLYSMSGVIAACLDFIDNYAAEILATQYDYTRNSFCAPEIDIFNAIARWIDTHPEESDSFECVLGYIRLSLIKLDDLLNIIRPTQLIDSDKLLDAINEQNKKRSSDLVYRGILCPMMNVAEPAMNAKVLTGEFPTALLLSKKGYSKDHERKFTRHAINAHDPGIIIELGRSLSSITFDCGCWIVTKGIKHFLITSRFRWTGMIGVVKFVRIVGTHNSLHGTFNLVSFEALYTTEPFVIDPITTLLIPHFNVATIQPGCASVIEGVSRSRNALLDGDTQNYDWDDGYTCHQLGSGSITIQLHQPYLLDSLRLLLWDCDDRTYSFYIEVSCDQTKWTKIVDVTNRKSWQTLRFHRIPVVFIRIVGTANSANEVFHCVHFETPATNLSDSDRPSFLSQLSESAPVENEFPSPSNFQVNPRMREQNLLASVDEEIEPVGEPPIEEIENDLGLMPAIQELEEDAQQDVEEAF
uniref:BACK domain-containing protein n=1 Tax=Ditylenchus dipsaci TaxID=166011 RepID=A0A915CMA9_9BILA